MAQNINNPDKPYKKNVHECHRQRLKTSFRKDGLKTFHEHNVLEMLLFYAIPRKDTNEIAHYLINEFGSFAAVFDAPLEALQKIDGVGLEAATLIKFIPELFKFYETNKYEDKPLILDSVTAIKYLAGHFIAVQNEIFVVMFLDGRGGLIKTSVMSQGTDTMVKTDFGALLKSAILLDAKALVIAHNHPSGFAVPSKEDILMTEKLSGLCKTLDIVLCEHVIFSGAETCLLSKSKGLKPGTCIF